MHELAVSTLGIDERKRWRQRPQIPPVMYQSWQRLLFLHWRCDPRVIQERLPSGLSVDTFDGSAWIAIVPFEMRRIRPCWSPVVPYISNFLEVNLRTYAVDQHGVPGVWFLSLDTNRYLAAVLGRRWFQLPYYWGQLTCTTANDGWIDYSCRRFADSAKQVHRWRFRPQGKLAEAQEDSLEFFLVERYVLFAALPDGRIASGQVHHAPYQIQAAELDTWGDGHFVLEQFAAPGRVPDHVLYSPGVDVEVFGLRSTK